MNALQAEDLVEVGPGEEFDPFGPGSFGPYSFQAWQPPRPGMYRVRFIYDASPPNWQEWAGDARFSGLDAATARRFARVHHERIESEWVDVVVGE